MIDQSKLDRLMKMADGDEGKKVEIKTLNKYAMGAAGVAAGLTSVYLLGKLAGIILGGGSSDEQQ